MIINGGCESNVISCFWDVAFTFLDFLILRFQEACLVGRKRSTVMVSNAKANIT